MCVCVPGMYFVLVECTVVLLVLTCPAYCKMCVFNIVKYMCICVFVLLECISRWLNVFCVGGMYFVLVECISC